MRIGASAQCSHFLLISGSEGEEQVLRMDRFVSVVRLLRH